MSNPTITSTSTLPITGASFKEMTTSAATNAELIKSARSADPIMMTQLEEQAENDSMNQLSITDKPLDNDSLADISKHLIQLLNSKQEQANSLSETMSKMTSNMKDIAEKSAL